MAGPGGAGKVNADLEIALVAEFRAAVDEVLRAGGDADATLAAVEGAEAALKAVELCCTIVPGTSRDPLGGECSDASETLRKKLVKERVPKLFSALNEAKLPDVRLAVSRLLLRALRLATIHSTPVETPGVGSTGRETQAATCQCSLPGDQAGDLVSASDVLSALLAPALGINREPESGRNTSNAPDGNSTKVKESAPLPSGVAGARAGDLSLISEAGYNFLERALSLSLSCLTRGLICHLCSAQLRPLLLRLLRCTATPRRWIRAKAVEAAALLWRTGFAAVKAGSSAEDEWKALVRCAVGLTGDAAVVVRASAYVAMAMLCDSSVSFWESSARQEGEGNGGKAQRAPPEDLWNCFDAAYRGVGDTFEEVRLAAVQALLAVAKAWPAQAGCDLPLLEAQEGAERSEWAAISARHAMDMASLAFLSLSILSTDTSKRVRLAAFGAMLQLERVDPLTLVQGFAKRIRAPTTGDHKGDQPALHGDPHDGTDALHGFPSISPERPNADATADITQRKRHMSHSPDQGGEDEPHVKRLKTEAPADSLHAPGTGVMADGVPQGQAGGPHGKPPLPRESSPYGSPLVEPGAAHLTIAPMQPLSPVHGELGEAEVKVQERALRVLKERAAGAFIQGMEDESRHVRIATLRAAAGLVCSSTLEAAEEALPHLLDEVSDEIADVRLEAVEAVRKVLGIWGSNLRLGDTDRLGPLSTGLLDSSPAVRASARKLLGSIQIGSKHAFLLFLGNLMTAAMKHPTDQDSLVEFAVSVGQRSSAAVEACSRELLLMAKQQQFQKSSTKQYSCLLALLLSAAQASPFCVRPLLPDALLQGYSLHISKELLNAA